ncbi:11265_t:CDS:2 [Entrophospora sp. SA101]|nr:11265_t:CDS:2 [Entrophospora sp. SA101]
MVREYECSKDIIEKPVPFLVSQMSKQAHESFSISSSSAC